MSETVPPPAASLPRIDPPDQPPVISVVVAVLNARSTIERCLCSVLDQTYPHVELVVLDGGSTDGTVDVLRRYSDRLAWWVSQRDDGIADAWNRGVARSTGRWICFLGADDFLWSAGSLAAAAAQLPGIGDCRIAYGRLCLLDRDGEVIDVWGSPWPDLRDLFRAGVMRVPHPGMLHRRDAFEEHGGFDPRFRIVMDYEWLVRELTRGDAQFLDGVVMAGMQTGGVSSRLSGRLRALAEVRAARRKHGLPPWTLSHAKRWVKAHGLVLAQRIVGGRIMASVRQWRRRRRSRPGVPGVRHAPSNWPVIPRVTPDDRAG
jgi:glycosyltransferase involved in cell wall biosynthesis